MPFEVMDHRGVSASPHFFEEVSFPSEVFPLNIFMPLLFFFFFSKYAARNFALFLNLFYFIFSFYSSHLLFHLFVHVFFLFCFLTCCQLVLDREKLDIRNPKACLITEVRTIQSSIYYQSGQSLEIHA